MNKTFNFTLSNNSGHRNIQITLPEENGMVMTGLYRPNLWEKIPFFSKIEEQAFIESSEFERDCEMMINFINFKHLDLWVADSYLDALVYIVECHLQRLNRIFINDLMIYIDEMFHIQAKMGRNLEIIGKEYAMAILFFVRTYGDSVKECVGPIMPFVQSNRYIALLEYAKEHPLP